MRLPHVGGRRPAELSGGQRQRVALARAIVNSPSVLLLDEPLGALDLKLREQMQVELKEIQRDVGITFVFVTHDQEEALTMSDRIAVVNAGRIEQVGTAAEVNALRGTRVTLTWSLVDEFRVPDVGAEYDPDSEPGEDTTARGPESGDGVAVELEPGG